MNKSPAPTHVGIVDVAAQAGVSVGTVSNYLNYPERVSETLQTRIQYAIDQLGYERKRQPKTTGRTRMSKTVALVMSDIEHSLFTSIFEGAQEICEDEGMQLIGMNSFSDKRRQYGQIRHLCQMQVAGILLSSVLDSGKEAALAKEAGIPLVMIDHANPPSQPAVCTVVENNTAAGEIAANELLTCGRRRIMFIGHSRDEFQAIYERWVGAKQFVERSASQSEANITYIDSQGIMIEDGYAIGTSIASMSPELRPDGIIAATDFLACGLVNALDGMSGIAVPDDIAVIGMEGNRLDSVGTMPLTVVAAPGTDMGRQSMRQLLDEMNAPDGHLHTTTSLLPTLIRRATTPAN